MSITEAFELYRLNYIIPANISAGTEENYRHVAKRLVEFFGDDKQFETLTQAEVRDWKIWLDKKRCAKTVQGYIFILRVILKYFKRQGYEVLEWDLIPVPKCTPNYPEFLTAAQVADLVEKIGIPRRGYPIILRARNRAIISLLYGSGLRATEMLNLKISDLKDDNTFTVVGKAGYPRLCFIDERTRSLIDKYLALRDDSQKFLFLSEQTGRQMSKSSLKRLFMHTRRKVKMDVHFHAHTMRHSFATNLLRNNANIRVVQELLGHKSLQTTQIYTHVVNNDLQRAYAQCHTI